MTTENAKEPEVIEKTGTEIKEFSDTESGLAELKEAYSSVPDCTTKEGYEDARKGISVLRSTRTSLDKMRLGLNADDQARIKVRNKEAARILELILEIETPLQDAKKAVDEEKERIKVEAAEKETKRIESIEGAVRDIHNHANCERTMEEIVKSIDLVEAVDENDGFFEEFAPAARLAKETSLGTLYKLRDDAQAMIDEANRVAEEAEKQAEEQKKLDADREAMEAEKKAAQDKLDAQQAEMDKKQKAMDDQQAEIDRQEQEKKDAAAKEEQDKLDAEKAEKEAKEQAERDEEDRKQAAAKMLADKELFTKDSKTLESLSKSVAVIAKKEAGLNYDTPEATRISDEVLDMLNQSIHLIINSDVVKSQQEQEEGEK